MRIRDDNCRRIYRMLLFLSPKGGHWETEKAESSNDLKKDMILVGRPAMMLFRMGMIFFAGQKKRIITGIVSCGNFLMLRKLPQLF